MKKDLTNERRYNIMKITNKMILCNFGCFAIVDKKA